MVRKFKHMIFLGPIFVNFSVKIQSSECLSFETFLTLPLKDARGRPRKLFLCLLEALILVISAPEPTRPKLPCFGDLYPPKHVFQYRVTH